MAGKDTTGPGQVRRAILARAPREVLYERARLLRIPGRSRMNKGELASALLERVDADDGLADVLGTLAPTR